MSSKVNHFAASFCRAFINFIKSRCVAYHLGVLALVLKQGLSLDQLTRKKAEEMLILKRLYRMELVDKREYSFAREVLESKAGIV